MESVESQDLIRLFLSSLISRRFRALQRDFQNRTRLHQELHVLGEKTRRILEARSVDVVHAHGLHPMGLLARATNFHPTAISIWGSDIHLAPTVYPYYRPLLTDALEWADLVNTASVISADKVRVLATVTDEKIWVSSWGADVSLFRPDRNTNDLRNRLGIASGPMILSFRHLAPLYRISLIVQAFSLLAQTYPSATLIIGNDGPLRQSIEALVEQLGLENRVIFTGEVFGDEMADLFSMADIYIQAPESDGVSISGCQALASGLPIVASNVGETSIIVKDGVNGFLVSSSEAEGFADRLGLLLFDNALRGRMSSESRRIALEEQNRQILLDRFISRITELS
jgi:glycosyltransferase involved in cell wall biosynthesis